MSAESVCEFSVANPPDGGTVVRVRPPDEGLEMVGMTTQREAQES